MKIKELRQKSIVELEQLLVELREKGRDMRFKAAQRQLKKVREIRQSKKMVAQILTLLKERRAEDKQVQTEGPALINEASSKK